MSRAKVLENNDFYKVLGWLHESDANLFEYLLRIGNQGNAAPKYLEVGVYAGKSTILIGESVTSQADFYVCDIFEKEVQGENLAEIQSSYSNLSRKRFETNYLNFHSELPNIIEDSSTNLENHDLPKEFTFIHIDGSHLFEIASHDLEFGLSRLASKQSFLVIDDWRSPHTIGVTAALWKILYERRAFPLFFTNQKFYLTKENPEKLLEQIQLDLFGLNLSTVTEEFFGYRALRVLDRSGLDGFNHESLFRKLIPERIYRTLLKSSRINTAYQKLRRLK